MRIGIDARELCGRATGVGRHLAGLLRTWASDPSASRHEFVLFSHEPTDVSMFPAAERQVLPGAGGTQWEQLVLSKHAGAANLDVFFSPGYTAPLRLETPTVVLVHDLSFDSHPEWFRFQEGMRRRLITRWSSRRAKLTLTVSETIREEILERYGLPSDRVRCIYPGIATLDPGPHAIVSRAPLVLYVGSIFNRRHIPDLIRAFKVVSRRHADARLEIVGDNRTYPHVDLPSLVQLLHLEDRIEIHPYLGDLELARRYRSASVFAFLSEYEGFGHPPLEALACGVPPIVLSTPVAHEVYGQAAIYVQRGDTDRLAREMDGLLFNRHARSQILDAAPEVLSRYSWKRAAAETLAALEAASKS